MKSSKTDFSDFDLPNLLINIWTLTTLFNNQFKFYLYFFSININIPLEKKNFLHLDLPNLLINIWEYTDKTNDPILIQYEKWCIEVAKQKWQPQFKKFDYVIGNLKERNKKFYDFDKFLQQTEM